MMKQTIPREVGNIKAIILNAGPRKNRDTAQLLKAARQGAEEAGAENEYFGLYDLNFAGCRSCLLCRRKDAEHKKARQMGRGLVRPE